MTSTFDVCIIGLGPAGLGMALHLADTPNLRMLCVDSGPEVQSRYCSLLDAGSCRWAEPCEMIAGVGGTSLLSGGKLSLYPAGRGMDPLVGGRVRTTALLANALSVFRDYVPLVAPEASPSCIANAHRSFSTSGFILRHYDSYRYARSDLVAGYRAMCRCIEDLGHDIRTGTSVENIHRSGDQYRLTLRSGQHTQCVSASRLVLATGRSGGPLLSKLATIFPDVHHPGRFDVGVRLEFPYECWPGIDQYHNDLKLEFGSARTFCVCTNGGLAPYRVDDAFLLEGYSDLGSTTGLTNLGIVLRVRDQSPHLFQTILNRVKEESGGLPVRELLPSFLNDGEKSSDHVPSSITFWKPGRVAHCYPADTAQAIRNAVHRLATAFLPRDQWHRVAVFAPEVDYYWPTIDVRTDFRTTVEGVFMVGDGTARFRGILQAFASGMHTASVIKGEMGHAV